MRRFCSSTLTNSNPAEVAGGWFPPATMRPDQSFSGVFGQRFFEHLAAEGRRTLVLLLNIAQTPLARVLSSAQVLPETKRRLEREKAGLNPFALKREIARSLKKISSLRQARRPAL